MPDLEHDTEQLLANVFHPFATEKTSELTLANKRLVHYCSAASAVEIIKNSELWLRNLRGMNDFKEAVYGYELLIDTYRNTVVGQRLKAAIESVQPGISEEIEKQFDNWVASIANNCFVSCLSVHENHEDAMGRLSMWRAYGQENGVALVINNYPVLSETDFAKVYSSPVAYLGKSEYHEQMTKVAKNIEDNSELLKGLEADNFKHRVFWSFMMSVLCVKHPGFAEEQEWRIIHVPTFSSGSHLVTSNVETIRGVPQIVMKLSLNWPRTESFQGLSIRQLLNRIIIGPTNNEEAIRSALSLLLHHHGIEKPQSIIHSSDIPLRT